MPKSWRAKHPDKIHPEPKPKLRKDIGDGYYILYKQVANGFGGYHDVEMELFDGQDQLVKKMTDRFGRFIDFPGVIPGDWVDKLTLSFEEQVRFVSWISPYKNELAGFIWTVQPDGRYWADEDGFGMEPDDEIELISYFNKKGEFVMPFADYNVKKQEETLAQFEERTEGKNGFIWDSLPHEGEFWPNLNVKMKVERDGKLKPFYGNTVVFPLKGKEDGVKVTPLEYVQRLQNRLYECGSHFLAEKLDPSTLHITLHDLANSPMYDFIKMRIKVSGKQALFIVNKLHEMDFPKIKMVSTCIFNMNSTSIVLGFKPASEEDCANLMRIFHLFQYIEELSYPLTPHVTLGYFNLGKNGPYSADEMKAVRDLIEAHKQEEKLVVELDIKDLVYQEFESMNKYKTVERIVR